MKSDTNNSASKKCHITFQHLSPEASNISYGTIAFCWHSVLAGQEDNGSKLEDEEHEQKVFSTSLDR